MLDLDRVYCIDALEGLKQIDDESIDCIFTDPPYGHNNNNDDLIARRESALGRGESGAPRPIVNDGPEANDLFKSVLPHFARVLKPGACCCCCCCGGGGPDPQFARWSLWLDEVLEFKQMVVWDKGPMGMGWHYRRSYETVLVAQKKGAPCKWYDTSHKVENIIRPGVASKIIPSASQHPTQKPEALVAFFLRLHSEPGDVVLDSFVGSGTVPVVAKKLGRHFIGFDISPVYVKEAQARINREMGLFVRSK